MRKQFTILLILVFVFALAPVNFSKAADLANRLKGRILLQVESKGEAWYVNPDNLKRYYLGRPDDAFKVMRELGLGITNKNFDSFNGVAPKRLSGKILIKVEDSGKAYYVNPANLKMIFLGKPADAFKVMRETGIGISNNNLNLIARYYKNIIEELDIVLLKTTFKAGETVEGRYQMKYSGAPFQGVVLYSFAREGYDKKYHSLARGNISNIDFTDQNKTGALKLALMAFKLNANEYDAATDSFNESGAYTYTISVYDCQTVENKLNKLCKDAKASELSNISSLKTKSKTVTVEGDNITPECLGNSQCIKTCEGCREGKQVCEQAKNICLECFMDSMCKDGYGCINNKCINN